MAAQSRRLRTSRKCQSGAPADVLGPLLLCRVPDAAAESADPGVQTSPFALIGKRRSNCAVYQGTRCNSYNVVETTGLEPATSCLQSIPT